MDIWTALEQLGEDGILLVHQGEKRYRIFLRGGLIRQVLEGETPLPPERARTLLGELARADPPAEARVSYVEPTVSARYELLLFPEEVLKREARPPG